jgi:hypothetical protein
VQFEFNGFPDEMVHVPGFGREELGVPEENIPKLQLLK